MSKKLDALTAKEAALIEQHNKQLAQIRAQKKDALAREKAKERKLDTRRKIQAGALALNHMQKNPTSEFGKKLAALIEEYVIKDNDRALFDLAPLPETEQKQRTQKHKQDAKRNDAFNEL